MAKEGVIYYAVGEKYLTEATESAESLKSNNNIHVTLFTDQNPESNIFDNVIEVESKGSPFLDRIKCFLQSPYEKTLYMDTDTIVAGDIGPIFEMLNRFDIVARLDPFRNTAGEHWGDDQTNINVPQAFPEYQCGVFGYRDADCIKDLFIMWEERYSEVVETDLIDQPFFREAVYHTDVHIGTLPSEYNLLVNNMNCLQNEAVIFHFNGGYSKDVTLPIIGTATKSQVMDKINSSYPSRRVVYPSRLGRTKVLPEPKKSLLLKLYRSLITDGVEQTVKKGVRKLINRLKPK